MSTRGMFSFIDSDVHHHVYRHSDCYPEGPHGGVHSILKALPFAWRLPRFEPDEFAAAYVCGNKMDERIFDVAQKFLLQTETVSRDGPWGGAPRTLDATVPHPDYLHQAGGIRLLGHGKDWRKVAPCDIAYRYIVSACHPNGILGVSGVAVADLHLTVQAVRCGDWSAAKPEWSVEGLYSGPFQSGLAWAMKLHEDQQAERAAEEAAKVPKFRPRPARMMVL